MKIVLYYFYGKIKTRQQARQLLNRYILSEGQEKNAEQIENALGQLFEEK